jgi:hypothetical protein
VASPELVGRRDPHPLDGEVEDLCWERKRFEPGDIKRTFAKHYEVIVRWDAPREWLKKIRGTLSYKIVDSFMSPTEERIEYSIDFPTKRAKLVVNLPEDCFSLSAHAIKRFGGQTEEIKMHRSDDGLKLELEIKSPAVGSSYEVVWMWKPGASPTVVPPETAVVQVQRADERPSLS